MRAGFHMFAAANPHALALIDPEGESWTRGRLLAEANRLTRAFIDAGLSDGDAVAIIAPNSAQFLVAYLATLQGGFTAVPINWHLLDEEIAFILEDSEAKVVVAHSRLGAKMLAGIAARRAKARLLISIGEAAEGYVGYDEVVGSYSALPLDRVFAGRLMAYTSATTGRPKGVLLPGRGTEQGLERLIDSNRAFGILPEDDNVHLCASMLYHSAPLLGVEVALHLGHCVVLCGLWQPELLLELIDRHRITTTFMVPTMFVRLLKLPASVRSRYSVRSLRFVVHGGAPCPLDVKRQMLEWWGNVVWESYGATEAGGTIASAEEWLRYPGTVGRAMPGSSVKVLDEHGCEQPPFEVGLVYMLPHVGEKFLYKGDPERTRSSYRGEYVTAGDLGYLNEEGYLFLCDRLSNVIISAGMNIYPAEIESALAQHPAVADCAVLAHPHALLGEVPKALVQVESRAEPGPALTADLLRHLREHVSAAKLPKRVEYVREIPRDPNGKLYKRRLRQAS